MRYVVLAIEDNDQAQTLVDDMLREPGRPLLTPVQENDIQASIVGMFAVPTKFCDDEPPNHRGKKTMSGWTRGKKYGWWVCGACKKPTRAWGTNLNTLLSSCVNLLAPNHPIGAARAAKVSE